MTISNVRSGSSSPRTWSGRPAGPPRLTATASLLGVSTSELTAELQSGSTLAAFATARGVSRSDLLASVQSDLKANDPQGARIPDSQLAQMATGFINGTGPLGGPDALGGSSPVTPLGGGPAAGPAALSSPSGPPSAEPDDAAAPPLPSAADVQANLTALATAAGIDPNDLRARIGSGSNLSGLLASSSRNDYSSRVGDAISGGVLFDQYA